MSPRETQPALTSSSIPLLKAIEALDGMDRALAAFRTLRQVLDAARGAEHATAEAQARLRTLETQLEDRGKSIAALDAELAARRADNDTKAGQHRAEVFAQIERQRTNALAEVQQLRDQIPVWQGRLDDTRAAATKAYAQHQAELTGLAKDLDAAKAEHRLELQALRTEAEALRQEVAQLREQRTALLDAARAMIGR